MLKTIKITAIKAIERLRQDIALYGEGENSNRQELLAIAFYNLGS